MNETKKCPQCKNEYNVSVPEFSFLWGRGKEVCDACHETLEQKVVAGAKKAVKEFGSVFKRLKDL